LSRYGLTNIYQQQKELTLKNFMTSYKNPFAVVLVLILVGGLFAYSKMQTSLFPEITFPKIKIIADAGLQPVDKMMVTVTKPLENAIKQVPDLQMIRSTTSRGSCEIAAFMSWDANIDLSLQQIQAKVNEINHQLPPETQVTIAKMNPSILPVMGYSLESHNLSPIELKMLANYTIKPFLSQVKGVSEIRVIGGKSKEYWIQLDVAGMSALRLTPDAVNTALAATNFIKSNGYLSDYKYLYLTVTDATAHTLQDIENTVVRNDGKRIVTIKDIAKVAVNEAVEYTKINANGHDGILIAVIKQSNANLVQLSSDMEQQMERLRLTLPKGVAIKPYYIQADFVHDAIKSVSDSLWIGLGLAIIVAIVFLRSIKASATILITIPITLLLTIIGLYSIGYTLNIMTLGAIAAAIGLIIDDAIVVVEQIHRTHEEHPDEPTATLLQKAVKYLLPAMIGSSISTIVIFIPFVLMSGVAGAYFKVMTQTMILTLLCSFFVTWIGLPFIYLLLSGKKQKAFSRKGAAHSVKPQRWVSFFMFKPWISIVFCVVLIGLTALILPQLQTGFLPEMDEGSIVLDYASPAGTSLQETDRILRAVEKIIQQNPDVAAYSRRTGTQMGFFITEPNRGDYLIQLKKSRSKTTDAVSADLRKQIESTQPALRVDFGQVITDMLGDLMTSVQPVEVKVFGNNQQQLQQYAGKVAAIISQVKGTADVFDGVVIAGPSVSITPDYTRLAQYGLTPANFQYQVQTALEGNLVGNVQEQEQLSPVRLLYPGSRTKSVDALRQLRIFLPNGTLSPIANLANVTIKSGDAEMEREDLQSMGVVTARLEGRDLGSAVKEIQQKIRASIALPPGYHIEYGGAYANQQQSFKELLSILILSSLLVFGVILFLFKEFKIACIILLIAVLGISGSYAALFLTHTPLNVGSYTGLIMIVGIIGENAIFTFLQFRQVLQTSSVDEAIVYAISTRLRPKLMTALGAIIALLPLALGIGAGAQLHQPLAIAVIGGFVVGLPLLIIVFPSLLRLLYKKEPEDTGTT
jgi:CzcA family heavy metal efflux pump